MTWGNNERNKKNRCLYNEEEENKINWRKTGKKII
jgi:hypothetical protein